MKQPATGTTADFPSYLTFIDRDPFPYYEQLRNEDPVHWDEAMQAWLVTRFDDCTFVMKNEEIFGHPYHDFKGAANVQGGARGILMLRGDEHTRMHRYLLQFFSKSIVQSYRETIIRPLVDRLLDRLLPVGSADLAGQFSQILPSHVIAVMLGIPIEDEELLEKTRHWNDDIMRWSETFGEDPDALASALDSAEHLRATLLPIIRHRRDAPGDDFISKLWAEGPRILEPWTEDEVLAQCRVLFFAGSETTAHGLTNALSHWLGDPEIRASLTAETIPNYVEEILRVFGVIHFRVRVAVQDVELGGKLIKKGDRVHPMNSAANRDAGHFDHADLVDLDRPRIKQHVAFNVGPRTCIGAELARGEIIEAIERVTQNLPDAELDSGKPAPRYLGHMPRSFRPLNVKFSPRTPA
jgi:cytochrome P450